MVTAQIREFSRFSARAPHQVAAHQRQVAFVRASLLRGVRYDRETPSVDKRR
jgi:hypothetical protein